MKTVHDFTLREKHRLWQELIEIQRMLDVISWRYNNNKIIKEYVIELRDEFSKSVDKLLLYRIKDEK